MAGKGRELGAAASGMLEGPRVRDDGTVAPRSGGVKGGRTAGGKVKIAAYVAPELVEALEAMAAEQDRSVSWLVGDAIRRYVGG